MVAYIDFHTHQIFQSKHQEAIYSLDHNEICTGTIPDSVLYFTVGFHPWWIERGFELNLDKIENLLTHKKCVGLGEVGLDRARPIDIEQQKKIFEACLDLVDETRDRVIVVHCVRAYSDVLQILKNRKIKVPIVFHDYNGNDHITKKLLDYGCFFSVGNLLFKEKTKILDSLAQIPLDKLFLETDDQMIHSIQKVYQRASQLLEIEEENLKETIDENFRSLLEAKAPE